MREDAVSAYLRQAGGSMSLIESLINRGELRVATFMGHRYYVRRFR